VVVLERLIVEHGEWRGRAGVLVVVMRLM